MVDWKFIRRVNKTHCLCHGLFCLVAFWIAVAGTALMGCAGPYTASKVESSKEKPVDTLYEVSEQEALDLVKWSIEQVLPGGNVLRLKKPRIGLLVHESVQKGIVKYARFKDAVFIYEIDLLPMEGRTAQGQRIVGYTYSAKGDGDLETGP
jgi:hypothetical protein